MAAIEVIITLACLAAFGILVLIGFLCLKKRFRLKWEGCCDSVFTCCGQYPSEKTEDLKKQKERIASRNRNSASVLNQPQPNHFNGRKRPEEIQPLSSDIENQQQLPSQQQYTDGDDVDVEAANDDIPIVQQYDRPPSGPSGRQSAGSTSRQQQSQQYYTSSTQRSYTSRAQTATGRSDRDVLVADDDEATL